ncbi:hypothetical protein MJO29_011601 [Puccinia striiformis f. sp. tritici]|nr:hypothetical protein MJO29_011601 [Puccinia striiformis f. sp. tritici]
MTTVKSIVGIVINGLKAMLESKTSHRILILFFLFSSSSNSNSIVKEWISPTEATDTRRAYLQFLGLGQISCLSPEIRAVLTCLMNAAPEDVLQFLKSPDDHTVQWAKHVNPLFYGRHQPNLDRITNRQTSLHLVECIHTQNGTQTQLVSLISFPNWLAFIHVQPGYDPQHLIPNRSISVDQPRSRMVTGIAER